MATENEPTPSNAPRHFERLVPGRRLNEDTAERRAGLGQERMYVAATAPRQVTPEARDAILESLHEERHRLQSAEMLGTLTTGDAEYLDELLGYIDKWEMDEEADNAQPGVADRFERLIASLTDIQARAEKLRR